VNDLTKNILVFIVIIVVLLSVVQGLSGVSGQPPEKRDYSEFLVQIRSGEVQRVEFDDERINYGNRQPLQYYTISPETDNNTLIGILEDNRVRFTAQEPKSQSLIGQLLISSFPILLLIGVWIYFMRQMQVGVSFADVAGIDEAKEEVAEIVDFLKDPSKFQRLGGKIPKGVLMVGAPGTGKTLLAKAIAGEAKVPFFTISGSDFVEMFVGVGASRVRDMFEQAKKQAPCIIFIDELDAVGRHRGAGLGGGHDEREQTLNQMLVEMDGFEGNEGVIVIAATNRPDVLDPALLRPGRFDRQVVVPLPDIRGRELILKIHMRKVPLDDNVKPSLIARGTPGFSGADLANLVNEAALFAARANKRVVSMEEFEKAKDKIMMGAERRSMVMSEKEKLNTAYHESGHAIVGYCVPDHDPVYKVTIMPRGRALGVTMYLPEEDRYSISKSTLESNISTLFGGRLAEEMTLGADHVTTGASNDIERATEIARNMVTKWGLSEKLGPLTYSEDDGEVFLGRTVTQHKQVSDVTVHTIDEEVRKIIDRNYQRAKSILEEHEKKLHVMAKALMKYETIDVTQVKDIMDGREPEPPADWEDDSDDSTPVAGKKEKDSDAVGKIGGPASEH
jgi:cell division protease FtsH